MENFSERSEILKLLESVVTAQRKFMGGAAFPILPISLPCIQNRKRRDDEVVGKFTYCRLN